MGASPSAPTYNKTTAINEQNRINRAVANQTYADMNSPLGSYSVYVDPATGQMTVNKELSTNSRIAQGLQGSALSSYIADPTAATNAYYNAQMNYINPQLDSQRAQLSESLAGRGIQMGSNAWNSVMDNFNASQNRIQDYALNNALFNGQQYQSNILNDASMLGGQIIDPQMINGQGGAGLYDTYDKQFNNQIAQYKTNMASNGANQQIFGTVGTIGGGLLGAYIGGPTGAMAGSAIGKAVGSGVGGAMDNR